MEKVKKIAKGAVLGLLGGLLYGFVSFYLITSAFRDYPSAIALNYGVPGLFFGIAYVALKLLTRKHPGFISSILIGAISGLISVSPAVVITIYNLLINVDPNVVILHANKIRIITDLVYGAVGYVIAGSTIGLLIGWKEKTP
jgi:hypothetical protein